MTNTTVDQITIPEISNEELLKRLNNLKILIQQRGHQSFFHWGLSDGPYKTAEFIKKQIFCDVPYTFKWDKEELPDHAQAVTCTIFTLRTAGGQFALTLEEVLAQIPEELEGQEVFAVSMDGDFSLASGGDYFKLQATYLVR